MSSQIGTGGLPGVFLDRDGTLMEDTDYPSKPEDVRVFPGAATALRRLLAAGYRLVIVTNQSGIGRGYFSEDDFQQVQAEFLRQLGSGLIAATYHCPDVPDEASARRKPAPGMIFEAAREHGLNLERSFIVGDKGADVECGRNAGLAGGILVLTGKGGSELSRCTPSFTAESLGDAVDWILQRPTTFHG